MPGFLTLNDLKLAIAKIKDIDCKVKAKVKAAVLTGDKINKVSAKALMAKIPDNVRAQKALENWLAILE
ncbi:hypothetical protein DSO57_1038380 [Entomophthora muscae]|uniref:Uncharacterized protein n=2 Tax=Entomophthora muscae TaxID=34485 RepID=A0ACC2SNC4_9FUNG|nr:hypothetical protein DSO57_1023465 [Entomophthora muscae]KAJ9063681.1 hypothetical protein DSO57_1038380 [Entomophthora muscae]